MAAEDWLPSVDDVAALVRARTKDDVGDELGTFTEATRPTAAAVSTLIANEAGIVLVRTGDPAALACPTAEQIRAGIRQVLAKRVAAIVEASYRPEDVAGGMTVADFYQGDMKDDLEAVERAAASCAAYEPGDSSGGQGPAARWYFPPAEPLPRGL